MKTTTWFALLLAAGTTLPASDIEVLSLTPNGRLTFTNSFTNGVFRVEWAPSVSAPNWSSSWDALRAFVPTSHVTTVNVPMFYRVAAQTNLFMPMPIGWQAVYQTTTAAGPVGTLQTTCLGSLTLSSGKEYNIIEMLTPCDRRLLPTRSTETELYEIPFDISTTEGLLWRNGPLGTTWTNAWCDGSSDQSIVAANETITVPAGTFDCLRIEVREINNNLRLRYVYWVKPGFAMVRQADLGNGSNPVATNSLASWSDRPGR